MAHALSGLSKALLLACACAFALPMATADAKTKKQQQAQAGQHKPLRGVIHYHGGYSYTQSQAITPSWKFIDPISNRQSISGPFDSGFFFDSGASFHGGDAPYQN